VDIYIYIYIYIYIDMPDDGLRKGPKHVAYMLRRISILNKHAVMFDGIRLTDFYPSTSVFPSRYHSPIVPYSYSIS
jgi:hypothetical protein